MKHQRYNVRLRTIPGFLLESQKFSLKFISASQEGQLSNLLEYQTDWKKAMQILLNSFETFPTNKTEVEKIGSKKLEEWALTKEGGDRHGILRERVSNARGRFISYCGRICGIL